MKKVFGLITLAIFMFMPVMVNAATANVSLDCTSRVKKEGTVTCTVKLSYESGITVTGVEGTIGVDSKFDTPTTTSFNKTGSWTGTGATVGTFTVESGTSEGTGTITLSGITVTGTDGAGTAISAASTTATDTVAILNNVASLSAIKVDDTLITGFAADKTSYTLTYDKESITVAATVATGTDGTVTGTGAKTLKCGANSIVVTAKAEDGIVTKPYTLSVTRTCNDDITLKGIKLNSGTLDPAFTSSVKSYTVAVSKDISDITIDVTKQNDTQKIEGTGKKTNLKFGENVFKITVTSEKGTKGTYTITVNREDSRSTNSYLEDIVLSDGKLTFDKETLTYNVKVLNEVKEITITATPEDESSKVTVVGGKNLKEGENTVTIKVTAENETFKEYKLIVTRLKEGETLGDNPNLKSLKIEGYDLEFTSDKTEYTLKIEKEKTLDIKTEVEEATTTCTISGNEDLKDKSEITIKCVSDDGTEKTYKIEIEKDGILLYIIAGVIALAIIVVLVILLINKNKGKGKPFADKEETIVDNPTMEKINTQLGAINQREEDQIKDQITEQDERLDKLEKDLEITKMVEQIKTFEETKEQPVVKNESPSIDQLLYGATRGEKTVADVISQTESRPTRVTPDIDEDDDEVEEVTKVCSICGHRIPVSTKVCPYCKKQF